eukprot:scaffold285_cov330-Pavlova_lutheri.AAC.92
MAQLREAEGRPACRFCFGDEGKLVEPCNCRGTQVGAKNADEKDGKKNTPERGHPREKTCERGGERKNCEKDRV